jgi:flagellar hook-associated protein 2
MGRIQSSVGLVTGVPIAETVDKLIAIQAQPRDALASRQKVLGAQQAAVTDLTALVLGVQFAIRRLKDVDLFGTKNVNSSHPDLLTATASAAATPGQYQFVPARLAQAHHLLSGGLAARDQAIGAGSMTFRFGGHVNPGLGLSDLNGGSGVSRGQIRITDRSGASAVIDLRFAQSIDDVLNAINVSDAIAVEAAAVGDQIVLRDSSGGAGNLRVQEVGAGATAAGLGLAGINIAANEATGQDLVRLFTGIDLDQLRDGSGLSLRGTLPELDITFRNGTTLQVDLDPVSGSDPQTLGDIISLLNAADPTRLQASISADGKRIQVTDLTAGAGTFSVASAAGGTLAEELGLTAAAVGGTITGQRIVSGLKTSLVGSLSGGQGLGALGAIQLTDRSGATASVNLAGVETLDGVIALINAANVGIEATYNSARNGLVLTDTTGATASNLIVANGDATNTATKLGLANSVAANAINSGSLRRQVISRNTLLDAYNGGSGVSTGSFLITNSAGASAAVNLAVLQPDTVGDVIDAINSLAIGVTARINDAGDGILLTDTAGGAGKLRVTDSGSGQAAADLRIAGEATTTTIDGTTTFTVTLDADDTLDDLVTKINDLDAGAAASVLSASSGSLRHHLSLLSSVAGKAGELLVDGSGLGLAFAELAAAQDSLLQVGGSNSGVLVSSTSNVFDEVLPGIDVTLLGASNDTVTVTVDKTYEDVAAALETFVENYNKLRDKLDTYTAYNPDAGTKGTLFASAETLRIDHELSQMVTGRYFNDGSIQSLAELGISVDDKGQLSFDAVKLEERFQSDPEAVTEFFADEDRGFAVKADALIEKLVGADNSMLINRAQTIQRQLDQIAERITIWDERLERSRERLMLQFFRLEELVSRIRNNLSAISQIQFIPPIQTRQSSAL